jgi:hypothetical protein
MKKIKLFTAAVFALSGLAFLSGCKDLWEKDENELINKESSSSSGTES